MRELPRRTLLVAALLYAVLFAVLGATVSRALYLPLIGLGFLRPVLREVRVLKDRDEWQGLVSYRSSHIAFLAAMFIAGFVFVKRAIVEGGEPPRDLTLVLMVALFVKFAALQMQGRTRRRAGLAIGWLIGGAWLLFSLASHGLSSGGLVESGIWLVVLASAFIGIRWRRIGGTALLVEGLGTLYFFVLAPLVTRPWLEGGNILFVALLLPLPLILAGVLLLVGDPREAEEEQVAAQASA